ncbi:hypothetical protein D3C81_2252950 [compost metagenome]
MGNDGQRGFLQARLGAGGLRQAVQEQAFDGRVQGPFEGSGHAFQRAEQFAPRGLVRGVQAGAGVIA